jgi:hypothetical protein
MSDIINGMEIVHHAAPSAARKLVKAGRDTTLHVIFPNALSLEHALRAKLMQHVSKDSDQFRQAFKFYTATHGIKYGVLSLPCLVLSCLLFVFVVVVCPWQCLRL